MRILSPVGSRSEFAHLGKHLPGLCPTQDLGEALWGMGHREDTRRTALVPRLQGPTEQAVSCRPHAHAGMFGGWELIVLGVG